MGKTLIITEKPSVARDYAKVLGVTETKDGYMESDKYYITWCVGHLVTMSYPEAYDPDLKQWNLKDLPFLPKEYKYEIIPNVKDQYMVIKRFMNSADVDTILYGGDSGREGEYIGRLVRMMSGVRKGIVEKRIWIDSFTEDEIRRGIREAKPLSDYDLLYDAATERAIEDYATGINFSRALSCKFGQNFNSMIQSSSWKVMAVGRVMTCVLGMIVDREREIRDFKPSDFFKISALVKNENNDEATLEWQATENSSVYETPLLFNEKGFKIQADAENFIKGLQNNLLVVDNVQSTEKKGAPLLFNLAELQSECSKKFKISPAETLETAQSLYEKKLTTYPRTDARVLSTAVAKTCESTIKGIAALAEYCNFCSAALATGKHRSIDKSVYTNDAKIKDHYAIIPTGNTEEYSKLSERERLVYDMIVRRFLAIFYPSAVYSKISVKAVSQAKGYEEEFSASQKLLTDPGYMAVMGVPDDKDESKKETAEVLKLLEKGKTYPAEYNINKGTTQPPKRYTSGSMVLAMENAGNLIEDEELRAQIKGDGIGTSATRAEVITKLVKNEYISLDKKTQGLYATHTGEVLYDIVKDNLPELLSPKITASWERGLEQIAAGEITKEQYEETINKYIIKGVETIVSKNPAEIKKVSLGKCPICGADVTSAPFGYSCSAYKTTGCKFAIGTICGKKIADSYIRQLCANRHTDIIKGFKSKEGKTFDAALKLNDDGSIAFDFPERKPYTPVEAKETKYECIKCGKKLMDKGMLFTCECGFKAFKSMGGVDLSAKTINELFTVRRTSGPVKGFKSKAGKSFDAYLVLTDEGFRYDFSKK